MGQYRKNPVVIDAIQWNPKRMFVKDVLDALGGLKGMNGIRVGKTQGELIIHTLEGDMTANPGDYIIKGIKGEVYPCKPDIFEMTYEVVVKDSPKCGCESRNIPCYCFDRPKGYDSTE